MDAFDADVLIYAAVPGHGLGRRVRALFPTEPVVDTGVIAGVGSVLLLPELLTKPFREAAEDELAELGALLGRLDLRPVDQETAALATALGAAHGLRAADAVHLATAVAAGADRFITNNQADFAKSITEIEVVYPEDLNLPVATRDDWRRKLFDDQDRLVVPSPFDAGGWRAFLGWTKAVNPAIRDPISDLTSPAFRALT